MALSKTTKVAFSFTFSILGAIVVTTFAIPFIYANRALPFTYVAGVDVGGQSAVQVADSVSTLAEKLTQQKIAVTGNTTIVEFTPAQLGVRYNTDSSIATALPTTQLTNWLTLSQWRLFFSRKTISIRYSFDEAKAQASVAQAFGATQQPADASITIANGSMTVVPAVVGQTIDLTALKSALANLASTGNEPTITLPIATVEPTISTDQANQVKSSIETNLHQLSLRAPDKTYAISSADELSWITFTTADGQLRWSFDKGKVNSYLANSIGKKLTIKMLPKKTQSDTGEVLDDGRDGQSVGIDQLTDNIYNAITSTAAVDLSQPFDIPLQTIAHTEQIVNPEYIAGLFPGLYVDVNLSTQHMFILNGTTKTDEFLISSGKPGTPTPIGQLYVCNKIELARSPLYNSLWMPKWNALSTDPNSCSGYRGYGVHDLPCFNQSCTIVEGESHLGRPVSHGCIRLGHDNATWFYDNIPVGTPVNVHT